MSMIAPAADARSILRLHEPPVGGPLRFALEVVVPPGAAPGDIIEVPVVAWPQGQWDRLPASCRPGDAYPIPGFGFAAYSGESGV